MIQIKSDRDYDASQTLPNMHGRASVRTLPCVAVCTLQPEPAHLQSRNHASTTFPGSSPTSEEMSDSPTCSIVVWNAHVHNANGARAL